MSHFDSLGAVEMSLVPAFYNTIKNHPFARPAISSDPDADSQIQIRRLTKLAAPSPYSPIRSIRRSPCAYRQPLCTDKTDDGLSIQTSSPDFDQGFY